MAEFMAIEVQIRVQVPRGKYCNQCQFQRYSDSFCLLFDQYLEDSKTNVPKIEDCIEACNE